MFNDETNWFDGIPFAGIKTTSVVTTGSEFYWVGGIPEASLFRTTNLDTGKMIIMFE